MIVPDLLLRDTGLLGLSWILGGLIGWQREARGRAAGLTTHVLVCVASCLITLVSFGKGDPGRIAAQIVSGIGFLGAGVILRRGVSVRGLTTAATIWAVAGIGIAVGAGGLYAALGTVATLLFLLTLILAKRLEELIGRNNQRVTLAITIERRTGAVARVLEVLTSTGAIVVHFEADDSEADGKRHLQIGLRLRQDIPREVVAQMIAEKVPDATFRWVEDQEG